MYEVDVTGWFAAAHQLRMPGGALEPLHGHNWHVRVTFAGPKLDESGLLVDFVQLRKRLTAVLELLHDRNLNELAPFQGVNPSAENVAVHIARELEDFSRAAELKVVEVEEAPGCIARYFPMRIPY